MSKNEDTVRLQHMSDAAKKVAAFLQGRSRSDLDSDEKLMLALLRLLEVIGEAAKSVSADFRQRHPKIAWKEIAGTRDRLIHGYFDVDLDIVWQIVTRDLPPLISELDRVIPTL